ncbi:FliI/YscN family ATPase [Pandoraea sp. XY-2]|uniref:FliI/YscN family ATPase n=1 Tax=Pandoraea sp. XY-2 TaxID=2518599 RepID=UPI00101AF30F|nr:FliI/YscN family ATPase [Pandoraea sp. XY-2]QBC30821.1 flagellum-specific ATP synthase FliI [Pandoraea sp. XY-2]
MNDAIALATPMAFVTRANGAVLDARGQRFPLGQPCRVETSAGRWTDAEVVGFADGTLQLVTLACVADVVPGARVLPGHSTPALRIGPAWLGRVVDALGQPLDGKGPLHGDTWLDTRSSPPAPLDRRAIAEPLAVGVRAIDGLLSLGKGQRVGLFAGSGVGKSVLLGMMTRHTEAQIVVVGLIGERGREVGEFVTETLGRAGLAKAIVVAAPADAPPAQRMKATELCHAIATHFRDAGCDVLLLVDSLTRYAMACREVALSLGEAPAARGYPVSVFARLPRLVECAGNGAGSGSLSAIYTVLAEGDDMQDPVVDTARAVLDGHIVLSRELADAGHYPAIDIGASVSRCMSQAVGARQASAARAFKAQWHAYRQIRELIPLGAYVPGAHAETDRAVARHPAMLDFLCQHDGEHRAPHDLCERLEALCR